MTKDEKSIRDTVEEVLGRYLKIYAGMGLIVGSLITFIYMTTISSITKTLDNNQVHINQLSNRMVGVERDVKYLINTVDYRGK